jgi:hypothetical protein
MIRLSSLKIKNFPSRAVVDHITAELPGGKKTRVHVARYLRSRVRPRLVVFSDPTPLLRWCKSNGVANAINGGFSLHHNKSLLGEVWIKGSKHDSVEFTQPWHNQRGSVHISYKGRIKIANGKLINRPQAGIKDNYKTYPEGRPIPNAIVFEPLTKHPSLI